MQIMLAGRRPGTWQDTVIREFCGLDFLDPRTLRGKTQKAIRLTLRKWISTCDCLLVYLPKQGSSDLLGLIQTGIAMARGVPVVVVDEGSTLSGDLFNSRDLVVVTGLDQGTRELSHVVARIQNRGLRRENRRRKK
jgi:hypothetical protein